MIINTPTETGVSDENSTNGKESLTMKMMKRALSLALAMVMTLGVLAGCTNGD